MRSLLVALLALLMTLPPPGRAQDQPSPVPLYTLPAAAAHYGIAFSPDETRFARWMIVPVEWPAEVIDTASGAILFSPGIVEFVTWSPDGRWIMAAGINEVRLYTAEGTLHHTLPGADRGRWLAGGARFAVWSTRTPGIHVFTTQPPQPVYTLADSTRPVWSPDEQRLIAEQSATGLPVLFEGDRGQPLAVPPDVISSPLHAWSPAGTQFITGSGDSYTVWSVEAGPLFTLTRTGAGTGCGVVAPPPHFVNAGSALWWRTEAGAGIYDALTGRRLEQFAPDVIAPAAPHWLRWAGTRYELVTATAGGRVLAQFAPADQVEVPAAENVVISYGYRGETTVWDSVTGSAMLTVPHYSEVIACGTFYYPPVVSPTGRYLVTWDSGGTQPPPYAGGTGRIRLRRVEAVTLRAGPSDTAAVVGRAGAGAVALLARAEAWWQVRTADDRTGWLYADGDSVSVYGSRTGAVSMSVWRVPGR